MSRFIQFVVFTVVFLFIVFLTNMGWIRVLISVPMFLHFFLFIFANYPFFTQKINSIFLKIIYIINISSYFIGYGFLPDSGDTNDSHRAFLGLITDKQLLEISLDIGLRALFVNILTLIILLIVALVIIIFKKK